MTDKKLWDEYVALEKERDALRAELESAKADAALTRCQLKTSRDDERQAMAYLSQVRKIVGGDDFLDMIERVNRLRAELDAVRGLLLTGIARRKWETLRQEGAELVKLSYFFKHPTKGVGTIDVFGRIEWCELQDTCHKQAQQIERLQAEPHALRKQKPFAYEVHRAMAEPYLSYRPIKGALKNIKLYAAPKQGDKE